MPVSAPGIVLTVVAVVLGGEAGGPQAAWRVDRGLLDGLRPGDRGSVHYVLTVADQERSIPAGEAVISTVEAAASWIEVTSERPIRPGYRVTFELPADRLAPAELLRAAREDLDDPEREAVTRKIIEERVLGGDEEVDRLLREELQPPPVSSRPSEAPPVSSRPSEASGGISARRSLDSAREDTGAIASGTPVPGMLLVPAGVYTIGAAAGEAAFYNQQPRFETFLEAFWIDAAPLRVGRVGEGRRSDGGEAAGSALVETASSTWLTDVTWAEAAAFCRRLGKRLPTEMEWEAAVRGGATSAAPASVRPAGAGSAPGKTVPHQEGAFALSAPILEWTASWYRPYAGNPVSEAEYGERYRVLRGRRPGESLSAVRRRFMPPDARHPAVGFRCVLDG